MVHLTKEQQLEMAIVLGMPKDPENPYPTIVDEVCETHVLDAGSLDRYYEVYAMDQYVYQLNGDNSIVEKSATAVTPSSLTWTLLTSEFRTFGLQELLGADEGNFIYERYYNQFHKGLNKKETAAIFALANTAATARGNVFTLSDGSSGETSSFNFSHFVPMIESIMDYTKESNFYVGATLWRDVAKMDWDYNKQREFIQKIKTTYNTNIKRHALGSSAHTFIFRNISASGSSESSTNVLDNTVGYLIGTDTEVGKPFYMCRRNMDIAKTLGFKDTRAFGDREITQVQRFPIEAPMPIVDDSLTELQLKVAIQMVEQVAAATKNSYACAKFTRS